MEFPDLPVWKKGLVVKFWRAGVHGCYLKTIDNFLFGRTVCLLINGFLGPVRNRLDYGLPQGSVLSPILFKFFCSVYEQISVLKFADDGTVKVVGRDSGWQRQWLAETVVGRDT